MEQNEERKWTSLQVISGSLTFSRDDLVGQHDGSRKPMVYRGKFNGIIPVAIKAYMKAGDDEEFHCMKRNFQFISSENNRHTNLIRYYGEAEDVHLK